MLRARKGLFLNHLSEHGPLLYKFPVLSWNKPSFHLWLSQARVSSQSIAHCQASQASAPLPWYSPSLTCYWNDTRRPCMVSKLPYSMASSQWSSSLSFSVLTSDTFYSLPMTFSLILTTVHRSCSPQTPPPICYCVLWHHAGCPWTFTCWLPMNIHQPQHACFFISPSIHANFQLSTPNWWGLILWL